MMRHLIQDIRSKVIEYAYSQWSDNDRELSGGYTILLPTPSDLPLFLNLALEIIKNQDLTDLKEILIIPDWPSPLVEEFYRHIAKDYVNLPIRFISLRRRDQLAWALTKSITTRHFTQLVRGIDETNTDYAIIHDSDLFLPSGNFLRTQYEACHNRKLVAFGVEPWQPEDPDTFVATWEMTFSVKWAKSFPPFMHRGQIKVIKGHRWDFDTTLLPQYLTDEQLIDWNSRQGDFFHFRYTIAAYRKFVNGQRLPANYGLKLFLIRTLIDAFDVSDSHYQINVPDHSEFLEGKFGLSDLKSHPNGSRLITQFKETLRGIISAKIFSQHRTEILEKRLADLLCSLKVDPD
jgi:hypothetical protein